MRYVHHVTSNRFSRIASTRRTGKIPVASKCVFLMIKESLFVRISLQVRTQITNVQRASLAEFHGHAPTASSGWPAASLDAA